MEYLRINGQNAQVFSRVKWLTALDAQGRLLTGHRPMPLDDGKRFSAALVREFAQRTVAHQVNAVESISYRYSTPGEMSFTRGTLKRETLYSAQGEVIKRQRRIESE